LFCRTCSTIFSSLVIIIIRRCLEFVAEAIIDKKNSKRDLIY
jgi:hypothetical protein